MLGVDGQDAVVIHRGRGTRVLVRRQDPQVQGYDWGRLTTDSTFQPLWVLLLPFTLANAAGWAHGHFSGSSRRIRLTRTLVHISAALLTASYVLWAAIIAADYLGYQALSRFGETTRVVGVVVGFLLSAGVLLLLTVIAEITRRRYERVQPGFGLGTRDGQAQWQHDEDLASEQFFAHDRSLKMLLGWHLSTVVVTVGVAGALAWANWGQVNLGLGRAFLAVGLLQFLVVAVLAVCCWHPGGRFPQQSAPRALPAAAVTLAVALSNGVWAGVAMLTAQLAGIPWDRWGQELALIESFVITVLLWAAALGIWLVFWRSWGSADELPARSTEQTGPHQTGLGQAPEPDGVSEALRARVAARRGLAQACRRAPQLLSIFAGLFLVSSLVAVLMRLDSQGPVIDWIQPPARGLLSDVAAVLLPALAVAAVCLVWVSSRWRALRGIVSIIWDVLTFWPRRYHPFAVRPYTERAVPEFQRLITARIRDHHGLIVSAHSQGSVLALAALAPMGSAMLHRCGLLSYGSPVTTLYGQAFPAYFGQQPVENLLDGVAAGSGGWSNLHRLTDEIGGPVMGQGKRPVDQQLPDPAENPEPCFPLEPDDPEPLRTAWADVAGHLRYPEEVAYKQAVRDFRQAIR